MNHRFVKRIVGAALSVALLFGAASPVLAGGDTMPPREGEQGYLGENQPTYHGHRAYDVLNWSLETDEYASFMRAEVPLQERNEAFSAVQANPLLDQSVQSLSLTEDYGNEFFNPTQYNDDFAQYVFNFWQYQDIRASWHGVVVDPTPDSLFNPEAGWWERLYEFGIVNIPNPAYTNAAHKNGVMSIGCIFFPRNEHTDDWVYQDESGRFPMADKLVEMANYYGFDGYFINAEEALLSSFMPLYEEFCRAMTSQGLYIQVYASNLYGQNTQGSWGRIDYYNKTAANFSNWIKELETIAANSLYMNPDPSKNMVDTSVSTMESLGLDATFDPVAVANNPDRARSTTWRGMSAFISERFVINGSNFYTSFHTGHGMQYFVDGKVSNESEWSNINIQDILPTWQWWIDTGSENRLTLDFDYGPEYNAGYDYTQIGGYEGSSSLAIFGDVDAQSDIRLYKTDLDVNENTVLKLTYNKPSKTDNSEFSLVLYLKDGEDSGEGIRRCRR